MKKAISLIFLFFVLLGGLTNAEARSKAPTTSALRLQSAPNNYNLIDGVALNASAANRTMTATLWRNWSKALVFYDLDRTDATDLTATFLCSPGGGNFYARKSVSISSGEGTLSTFSYTTGTISADTSGYIEADVRGCQAIRMVWAGTSGGANDILNVQVTVVAGE